MNIHIKILTVAASLVTLIGCMTPKYIKEPETTIPVDFRNNKNSNTVSIGMQSISAFFPEKQLVKLIDSALVRNYDLQIAIKNIESAGQLLKQSKLGNIPELNLQIGANSTNPSENSLTGLTTRQFLNTNHLEDYNANLFLSWEADIWGKIKNQKKEALAIYLQTEEAKKAIQTQLVATIAKAYYRLVMMDEQLDIAKKNLSLSDSTLTIIQLQFSAGQVTNLAVQQAKAQRLVSALLVPKIQQDIVIQENAISLLTGSVPETIDRAHKLEKIFIGDRVAVGYPAGMVNKRPDVRSAELSLTIANARMGIAKANLYPSINITATGGLSAFQASNWFNIPASLFGTVAGGLTQPLLQKRRLKTQFQVAKIEREKAVISFRQSVLTAVTEVSDELVKIEKLTAQYDISKEKVETLQQAVKNANLLFAGGMATYLEIITAQSNSLNSELELTAIKTQQLNAIVDLYRKLGGGLK